MKKVCVCETGEAAMKRYWSDGITIPRDCVQLGAVRSPVDAEIMAVQFASNASSKTGPCQSRFHDWWCKLILIIMILHSSTRFTPHALIIILRD